MYFQENQNENFRIGIILEGKNEREIDYVINSQPPPPPPPPPVSILKKHFPSADYVIFERHPLQC